MEVGENVKGEVAAGAWKRNLKTRGHLTPSTSIYKNVILPHLITKMPLLGL